MNEAKKTLIFTSIETDLNDLGTLSSNTKALIKKNQEKLYDEYLKECCGLSFKEWIMQGGC